ncbi:MAG: Oligopeptide transport system permease protein OppB [Chlamydiia bacterium]|nr:Oligopeptide transport system permease protein OppB [Chlamydiia bacterium]MCH9615565.1 Oligopeptide transport system permease protein OppB [Chlamydiia bacterium]MCH9629220.1 Oligopeptide transport system permease protein OppB [Chlamydiia bacterium]
MFIGKKFLNLLLSLSIIITLTFFLMHLAPGDPFAQEQPVPEEILRSLHAHYGLDKPIMVQFWNYLKGIMCFDLGPSLKYEGRHVVDIIRGGMPFSFILGLQALLLSVSFGVLIGAICALNRRKPLDRMMMLLAVFWISMPNFILATLFQFIFSMKLGWLPVARMTSFAHTVLPTLALAAMPTAFIARLTRTRMIEVLSSDYIVTARSKGVRPIKILLRHVLKNSLLPIVAYLGPLSCQILTGSFVVERIFGIPGLGGWFVNSVNNRDYTVIMGLTIFLSALLLLTSFVIDLIYPLLDPRIKLKEKRHGLA